ncbi:MAG: tetratricopeptide repeat protein [Bacteroidales bacterium]|nr:tetratricopeptide repeat protein [Bacteroidales bacterium]
MSVENKSESNFDHLKSKIRDLYIPLPNFKYFHKPSSEEEVFENFIGREEDCEQLEEWLTNGDSGTYLVTGYRGMGKTSLVGKVLNKITSQLRCSRGLTFLCVLLILIFVSGLFVLSLSEQLHWFFILWVGLSAIFILLPLLFTWQDSDAKREKKQKEELKDKEIEKKHYNKHKIWFDKIFDLNNSTTKANKHNLVVKINLGHENLKEKDILSLVAKRIYDKYEEYLSDFYTNWARLFLINIAFFACAILAVRFLAEINITGIITDNIRWPKSDLLTIIKNLVKRLTCSDPAILFLAPRIITKIVLCIAFYFIVRRFFYFAVSKIPTLEKQLSSKMVLEDLRSLIDRIDAAVTERSEQKGGTSSFLSFNFSRKKDKAYPLASTREIEDQLIQILDKIQKTRGLWKGLKETLKKSKADKGEQIDRPLKFIIVFDELDKIDPVYNHITKAEQNIPEFDSSVAFQGGSAMRHRKQNVLRLLGNMKLFMSQAKAKFVFISGRELYDAFLADVADREFAVSSIFNGIIYVNSFLESSTKEKSILTKTEEYICGYLIPKKYYKEEAGNRYKDEKEKSIKPAYRLPSLRMYKKFLIDKFIKESLETFLSEEDKKKGMLEEIEACLEDKRFESFEEFVNLLKKDNIFSECEEYFLPKVKHAFLYIEKVIVFLNQLSIYLTIVSNGSPKKITLYFENYIRMFNPEHEKNPFSEIKDKKRELKDSEYCLAFKASDQQSIGFVNYLTYPIIQTVINNSSHFGDKMLISASFLIDHIFKHHRGGFSHENIEHTPELLEVYSVPYLRTMIDTILSFLRQNHVTDISGGVYQYRFRKTVADEIEYNSNVSDQVSALFNFSLDESLPVKHYYYKQIAENEKKYLALEERIHASSAESIKNQYANTLISQLETLGEIHLWDGEYNEAIQHLQTAFEIIKSELRRATKDKDKLQLYVLLTRTALKLGLVKECKGYYDEAFVIYNILIDYLTEFRSLKEAGLGLNYFFEDNNLIESDGTSGEWKTKKTSIYHNAHGHLLSKYRDDFYKSNVLPFYREMDIIQDEKIDFLIKSDYIVPGLSKILSPEKQEIISKTTLFSEVKSIFQVILANLFIVEKIDHNGITQENLDLAENQFKYIYLLTDSKDKFIQAVDFYKKLASILFLKNYSNPKPHEYLQMWGFDIYETIDEFCFIINDYEKMIAGKFPKEILKISFVDESENLWRFYINWEINKSTEIQKLPVATFRLLVKHQNENQLSKQEIKAEERKVNKFISDFISFGLKKRNKYFKENDLKKSEACHKYCMDRSKNHPCYACNYISKSLDIFRRVLSPKCNDLRKMAERGETYEKRKSYFFKLLKHFKNAKANNNLLFVLASSLKIKADVLLSCVNGADENELKINFLSSFFNSVKDYYDGGSYPVDGFTEITERRHVKLSKLEKSILYYWLASEYFYLSNSPVDANECLTKILIIFDRYLVVSKELQLFQSSNSFENPFSLYNDVFRTIRKTIVRRILKNSRTSSDNVNYIELQNLKHILRSRNAMRINLSNLSTITTIEKILFPYCKLELGSIDIEDYGKNDIYLDCYKSSLLSRDRLTFTFQEKIRSLEFKEKVNMAIFEKIFEKSGTTLSFYDDKFSIKNFSFLKKYFNEIEISEKISELLEIREPIKTRTKVQILHFLISDSLYCLTQIVEILSSSRFSTYSHSFIGNIYHQISKWATLYQHIYAVLPKYNNGSQDEDIELFIKREVKRMGEISQTEKEDFEKGIKEIVGKLSNKEINIMTRRDFETSILNDIGDGNRHFLVPVYSVAMVLKYYHKAIGINSEGKEYKDMINEMYIVDDDISNGMHNFSLALERYTMNCGVIKKKMDWLRENYEEQLSGYGLKNYLSDTSYNSEE